MARATIGLRNQYQDVASEEGVDAIGKQERSWQIPHWKDEERILELPRLSEFKIAEQKASSSEPASAGSNAQTKKTRASRIRRPKNFWD